MDLTALTRALLHPMDRIAWLSVLRAPWCGLTVRDLHALAGSDTKDYYNQPAMLTLLRERTPLLSADGQGRAARVLSVLEDALRGRHRQVSLAQWVERTWATLGGRACVDRAGYANVHAFFAMLEQLSPAADGLEEQIAELCAQPDPAANERCGVHLMTIHKAKGLGFGVVIVPGLGRATRSGISTAASLAGTDQAGWPDGAGGARVPWLRPSAAMGNRAASMRGSVNFRATGSDEAKRLLYVAATRARKELHLLGTATVRRSNQELSPGSSGTLLGIAWTALKADFERARREEAPAVDATPQQAEFLFPPASPTIHLRRLPADWKPPGIRRRARDSGRKPGSRRTRPRLTGRARIRHRCACAARRSGEVARHGRGGVSPAVLDELRSWRPRALAMLRSAGLPRVEAEPQAAEVVRPCRASSRMQKDAGFWERVPARGPRPPGPGGPARKEQKSYAPCAAIASFAPGPPLAPPKKHTYGSWTTRQPGMVHPAWMPFSKVKRKSICTSWKLMPPSCARFMEKASRYGWHSTIRC